MQIIYFKLPLIVNKNWIKVKSDDFRTQPIYQPKELAGAFQPLKPCFLMSPLSLRQLCLAPLSLSGPFGSSL